ncbi:GntR family transcriptional regulator [Actinosynnema sp. NPDC023587]|uniref:GntR family transcriptional regulator n=1 Tax=Actinosynnema sp. NPDC023587 TaxID=3154695 RepID=UPI00340A0FFD
MHQQVARNIRNQIAAGVLRDGQQLPSTRDLAEQWNVSVFTINEAMKLLADDGVITSKPRAGRVVNAPDQAQRSEVRAETPRVLLVGGYAGSGKTELGRVLARETGWPMLDKDTLTRPVVEAALEILGRSPNDRESDVYLSRIRPREYESLVNTLVENVQCGNSAIVTAPFIKEFKDPAWLNKIEAMCHDMGAQLFVVWVFCDSDTMNTYIRHRGAARDSYKLDNWPEYIASVDTSFRPAVPHLTIDNSASGEPLQAQARELVSHIMSEG